MNKNLSEGNMEERNFQKGKNKLRIVAILAVAVILLVQGIFFYSLLFQYDTYGMPSSYEYYISFDEWLKMIDQAQTMKHTWFLDNTIGINEASVIAMIILFAVLISLAKGCQVRLRGIFHQSKNVALECCGSSRRVANLMEIKQKKRI